MTDTTLTPQLVALASALVRTANPDDASLHRALVKAEPRILEVGWQVDHGILCIQSYSTPGLQYHVDEHACECKTSKGVCWHRAAYQILSVCAAAGIAPLAPKRLPRALQPVYDDRDLTDPSRTDYPWEETSVLEPAPASAAAEVDSGSDIHVNAYSPRRQRLHLSEEEMQEIVQELFG